MSFANFEPKLTAAATSLGFLAAAQLSCSKNPIPHTPHILDLVLTDKDIIKDIKYLSPIGNSDHCVLDISCDCNECSRINSDEKFVTIAGHSTGHSRCRYLKGRFCLELIRAVNQFC